MKLNKLIVSGLLAGVFMAPMTGLAQLEEAMGTLASDAWQKESIGSERSNRSFNEDSCATQKMAKKEAKKSSYVAMTQSQDD